MSFRSKITFRRKIKSKRVRSDFNRLSIVCICLSLSVFAGYCHCHFYAALHSSVTVLTDYHMTFVYYRCLTYVCLLSSIVVSVIYAPPMVICGHDLQPVINILWWLLCASFPLLFQDCFATVHWARLCNRKNQLEENTLKLTDSMMYHWCSPLQSLTDVRLSPETLTSHVSE